MSTTSTIARLSLWNFLEKNFSAAAVEEVSLSSLQLFEMTDLQDWASETLSKRDLFVTRSHLVSTLTYGKLSCIIVEIDLHNHTHNRAQGEKLKK